MWIIASGYLVLGLLTLVYSPLGPHLVHGFRMLVGDYYQRPGPGSKAIALCLGMPAVLLGFILALGLFPLMLCTRKWTMRLRPRYMKVPYRSMIKGFPPVYHN
jgi:hypothetical protein